jgi:putative oxidoreductase
MKQSKLLDIAQLILRIVSGFSFFYYGCDRLGFWGKYGDPNVSWGDWSHHIDYASKVMGFLPYSVAKVFAAISTACEISFGLMLLVGFKTKWAALGVFFLAGFYALSMSISFGIFVPLSYSVFTFSAAGLLLFCLDQYKWSVDALISKR